MVYKNADASYDLYLGPKAPNGQENNWLQTLPGISWFVLLRMYGPLQLWINKTWRQKSSTVEPVPWWPSIQIRYHHLIYVLFDRILRYKNGSHSFSGNRWAIGSAIGSSGTTSGMQYTVKLDDGKTVNVVSDQLQIKAGDCVSVEQVKDMANIREQDPAACNPEVKEALPDLQDEFVEDAQECAQVKQELLEAKTAEAVELATAKARILCN